MKYQLLKPPTTLDPRYVELPNLDALYEKAPKVDELSDEESAMEEVRDLYPDALAMPCPIQVGSGKVWTLGIIESVATVRDADAEIPFVLFVMAKPERDRERVAVKNPNFWNKKIWKPPVLQPAGTAQTFKVELRATDLDDPRVLEAKIGSAHDKRTVIYLELNGVEMSLAFTDVVQIVRYNG